LNHAADKRAFIRSFTASTYFSLPLSIFDLSTGAQSLPLFRFRNNVATGSMNILNTWALTNFVIHRLAESNF
jgi:hypothetical protein